MAGTRSRTALITGPALLTGLLAASIPTQVAAADAMGHFSLPWSTGASWYFNGPHNWGETASFPWNSLDLNGGGGAQSPVLAAGPGIVHFDGCSRTDGYVRIDESFGAGGWSTTYYHLSSLDAQITEGAKVNRGQLIGNTGQNIGCFRYASAQGNHVHFSIWWVPANTAMCFCAAQEVDWQGLHGGYGGWQEQIGNYVWTDGTPPQGDGTGQYAGCAMQIVTGARPCWQNYLSQSIYNDGVIAGCGKQVDGLHSDLMGNGLGDLVAANDTYIASMLSNGSSFGVPTGWWAWNNTPPLVTPYGSHGTFLADVSGDTRADLVAVNDTGTQVFVNTGYGGFADPRPWSTTPFYGTRATLLADLTGDGLLDLIAVNDTSALVMLSNGASFGPPMQWSSTPFYGTKATLVGDVAGTGRAAVIALNDSSTWVMTSTGTSFSDPALWSSTPFYGDRLTLAGDVSGDGKADLVAVDNSSSWVTTSTGSAFSAPAMWSNLSFYGTKSTLLARPRGTTYADEVAVNDSSTWVQTSSGTSFNAPALWSSQPFYGACTTL